MGSRVSPRYRHVIPDNDSEYFSHHNPLSLAILVAQRLPKDSIVSTSCPTAQLSGEDYNSLAAMPVAAHVLPAMPRASVTNLEIWVGMAHAHGAPGGRDLAPLT